MGLLGAGGDLLHGVLVAHDCCAGASSSPSVAQAPDALSGDVPDGRAEEAKVMDLPWQPQHRACLLRLQAWAMAASSPCTPLQDSQVSCEGCPYITSSARSG